MKWKLEIRAGAEQDFNDAADWYYSEDPQACGRFVNAIEKTLAAILRNPASYPIVFGSEMRRAVVNKFPFSVFFALDSDRVVILSVSTPVATRLSGKDASTENCPYFSYLLSLKVAALAIF